MEKLFLIVIYKCDIEDSHTLLSLRESSGFICDSDKIIIWDNSPNPQMSDDILDFDHQFKCTVEYISCTENMSLSKVYNNVIKSNSTYEIVYFFDQDSLFDINYLMKSESAVIENPDINLFLPIIKSKKGIASPGFFKGFKGKYWESPRFGRVNTKGNIAVTSGMCVRMQYLQTFGWFEERLDLYGIDTNFMIRYGRSNKYFYVLDTIFEHDMSDFNIENADVKLRRFKDLRKSAVINSELFPGYMQVITRLFFFYKSVRHAIKYKRRDFLF